FNLSSLKGKKVMIVNVASACGLTPQYEQLQAIYEQYKDKGFEIIAFPSNDFKEQESGSNEEIKSFCTLNFGVSFPMMSKIKVKGEDKAPLYEWLTSKSLNGKEDSEVAWNFQKYLINPDGSIYKVISPKTRPDDPVIIEWITGK
ncbi:MAG: glutathione peroxidase, partial [Bacteroidales bacterium]